jgi:hypothetical protein
VQRARHQLLASASLARDQHRGFGGRDRLDLLYERLPERAATDDFLEVVLALNFFLQVGILDLQPIFQLLHLGERVTQRALGT